jgi:hypothetical protein
MGRLPNNQFFLKKSQIVQPKYPIEHTMNFMIITSKRAASHAKLLQPQSLKHKEREFH